LILPVIVPKEGSFFLQAKGVLKEKEEEEEVSH
jgi:hypothetical protein